jgi:hypothetical protein
MEISRSLALSGDIGPHAMDLIFGKLCRGGHFFRRHSMVESVKAEIHAVVRKGEVEFFLRLGQ